MKKLKYLGVVLLWLISFSVSSQNSNIKKTKKLLKEGKSHEAISFIEEATNDPKTKYKAITWYYRGRIFFDIAYPLSKENIFNDTLDFSFSAFRKCLSLQPKRKMENKVFEYYNSLGAMYYNKGVGFYEQNNHSEAAFDFYNSYIIYNSINSENEAKAKKYANYSATTIFNELISDNKHKQLLPYIDLLIQLNGGKSTFWFAKGSVYQMLYEKEDNEEYFEKADSAFRAAIGKDSLYFDAYYNLGALYFNKASELQDNAIATPDIEEYKIKTQKVEELIMQAIPWLEKAYDINPNDEFLNQTLKSAYLKTKQMDKYDKFKK